MSTVKDLTLTDLFWSPSCESKRNEKNSSWIRLDWVEMRMIYNTNASCRGPSNRDRSFSACPERLAMFELWAKELSHSQVEELEERRWSRIQGWMQGKICLAVDQRGTKEGISKCMKKRKGKRKSLAVKPGLCLIKSYLIGPKLV